ncbi:MULTISPECIES: beta-ketoacyl-[acyl-carrier-protein] synthase family protein [Cellulomonas]|uniref:beta-ketoacyl-[acyl-carrier-protein] synthase family protein n=1 Tax=Cellulomonas TaxID=1707 RepID=UPI0010A83151|nr:MULTISPECIES: beta-ketoacyl-[acyl-carrier-protein] synthase family protein [Cellulomonas]
MSRRRVVVTGMGVVSPLAVGADAFWAALLAGRTSFTPSAVEGVSLVSVVPPGWDDGWPPRVRRYTDRCTRMALRAAQEALAQADVDPGRLADAGVYVGSSIAGVGTLSEEFSESAVHGLRRMTPLVVPKALMNMIAANLSIHVGARGEALTYASACASGTVAIGEAYRRVRDGDVDVALAGGAEACVVDQVLEPFRQLGAMTSSDDPGAASVPFSRHRSGFVMAEGAAMCVLEDRDAALARGARVLGEVRGYHGTSDARSLLAPDVDGMRRAMQGLLARADLDPQDVGYVNAHGTSTPLNDALEGQAIGSVLPHRPLVSSTKSAYGHPFGAAGAFEVVACLLALRDRVAPATVNVLPEHVDPEIDLNLVLEGPAPFTAPFAVSNSFAFGGHNASIALAR